MRNLLLLKLSIILVFLVLRIKCEDESAAANETPQGAIKALSFYCTQYNMTTIYLDEQKIESLPEQQYVLKDFRNQVLPGLRIDYIVQFILAAKGLCYYENPNDLKAINELPYDLTYEIKFGTDTEPPIRFVNKLRYAKSTLCSYYYDKYRYVGDEDTNAIMSANWNKHKPCYEHCIHFVAGLINILNDPQKCPLPNFTTMVTPPNVLNDIGLAIIRDEFIQEIQDYCTKLNNQIDSYGPNECKQEDNLEVVNCGLSNNESKLDYCNNYKSQNSEADSQCCDYVYTPLQTKIKYEFNKTSIITGVSTAGAFIVLGSFFSARYIKEIRIQESIKKSIMNQEREYQESNKQLLQDAYNQGFNPDDQVYNSSSRNLNTGTLRPRAENISTMNSYGSSGRTSNMTSGTTMGRYPPNSYQIAQDYQSTDERDLSLKRGMIVQLVQKYEGGWIMVKDISSNRQGYAPEYCLGNKMA